MSWSRGPGHLGLRRLRSMRPLGYGRRFVFPLLDCLEHIAGFRYARPVDLLLRLAAFYLGGPGTVFPATTLKVLAHPLGFVFFERAGVRLLLGHADGRQGVKDRPALNFKLTC